MTTMSVLRRVQYIKYAFRGSTWQWLTRLLDSIVEDHLQPWSELARQPRSTVHPTVSFRYARNVILGRHTRIQPYCILWAAPRSRITVGNHSGLGPGTMIFSSNHQRHAGRPYYTQPWDERDVTIGEDVWVGAGTVILAGVTIGDRCVIAAGSIVTKDIPSDSLAAGVPARVVTSRV